MGKSLWDQAGREERRRSPGPIAAPGDGSSRKAETISLALFRVSERVFSSMS